MCVFDSWFFSPPLVETDEEGFELVKFVSL
jgi:hypothetical protein